MNKQNYAIVDHHSIWGWNKSRLTPDDADIVFVWNDFSIEDDVRKWQKGGKKIICFEHGWNAFFDYELNSRKMIADGYMALGYSSAKSLINYGLNSDKILVTGNPHFDSIEENKQANVNPIPKILFTALHWTRDMRDYNNIKLKKIIEVLLPYTDITVKTIEKSKVDIPKGIKEWRSEITDNVDLFNDIREWLVNYDIILTPKESTFDLIALKMGKKVFRIGEASEYRLKGDQQSRNILPYTEISTDIIFNKHQIMVNIENEIWKSIKMTNILDWIKKM